MNRRRLAFPAVLGIAFISQLCAAQAITVADAADVQYGMQDVAARFERETGTKVKVIFGSSGNFFQQIQNGWDLAFVARSGRSQGRADDAAGNQSAIDMGPGFRFRNNICRTSYLRTIRALRARG